MSKLKRPDTIKKLAKMNNTSTDEILLEIEKAINAAINNPDLQKREVFLSYFGGNIPTPEEFIQVASDSIIQKAGLNNSK